MEYNVSMQPKNLNLKVFVEMIIAQVNSNLESV